jgi:hypothetical protein
VSAETDDYGRARQMLARFGGRFDDRERALLEELVENNEHGAAFEMLTGMLVEDDSSISPDDLAFLRELGRDWETPRDPIPWAELEARVD